MSTRAAVIAAILLLAAAAVYSLERRPHDFNREECVLCHTDGSNRVSSEAYESLTAKCMTCHKKLYDNGYMHPVDVRPKNVQVPFDFPLSPSGTITCATCHDIHGSPTTPSGQDSAFLRRQEKGKRFCDICHQATDKLANGHEAVFREAHFDSKYIAASDARDTIDSMSLNCLTCHDGSMGKAVTANAGAWRHQEDFINHDNGGMHPIGMRYSDAVMNDKKAALRPLEQVDKRIRFFDGGKVGCGSCHDPYSTIPNQLVIEDRESKLCFACHQMDGNYHGRL